ncbi:DUF6628 family protein [Sphingomonas solaris]|uniref:Uncharacterized protein n=1 Tax=Alterirhizorhabdus solaris TaxID=2529389 RepID=A0A558R0F0_9SPHN|nr:DUF6628 family protein [Sphingomonas solaris]TVV72818.1 hypothetical protein FOY91_13505 [Sphingomonas solaris]
MPQQDHDIAEILPEAAPTCPNRQLLLFAIRRVAACGLNDAHATHAFFITFGRSFRRPLVLLRALMAEVSRVSRTKVMVAPCCCPRLTGAEANLLAIIADSNDRPRDSHDRLSAMLGVRDCLGALSSAQALALAFEDCGKPLTARFGD